MFCRSTVWNIYSEVDYVKAKRFCNLITIMMEILLHSTTGMPQNKLKKNSARMFVSAMNIANVHFRAQTPSKLGAVDGSPLFVSTY